MIIQTVGTVYHQRANQDKLDSAISLANYGAGLTLMGYGKEKGGGNKDGSGGG
jgi:hypothetical protein